MLLLFLLLFVACTEKNIHINISNHLEKTLQAEEQFIEQQAILLELEEKDMQTYDAIIQLEEKDTAELNKLIEDALSITEERENYIQKEKEAIDQSKEQFRQVKDEIEKVKDPAIKKLLEKLYGSMDERYTIYEEVYTTYIESLDVTESLYKHFKKGSSHKMLQELIDETNNHYEQLISLNERFNLATKKYNRYKKEYEALIREQ